MEFIKDSLEKSIPASWFPLTYDLRNIFITAYRCLMSDRKQFDGRRITLGKTVVIFYWGTIRHIGVENIKIFTNVDGQFSVGINDEGRETILTEEGPWVIILQKFPTDKGQEPLFRAQKRRTEVAAIVAAVIGRQLVFERVVENEVNRHLVMGKMMAEVAVLPDYFISPLVTQERVEKIEQLYLAIEKLDEANQRRINLALHWYDIGIRTQDIDSFINLWIAIEALILQKSTTVTGDMKAAMGRAYKITPQEASDKFGLGRLHGYRSAIMHGLILARPSPILISYVANIFVDLLYEKLSISTERRAEISLPGKKFSDSGFDLNEWQGTPELKNMVRP